MDTHYQEWNFICSYGYTKSGATALCSGHLFRESRLLVQFSEISFALMHVCYLGNILVLSTVNLGLVLIWLQKNTPDYVKLEVNICC